MGRICVESFDLTTPTVSVSKKSAPQNSETYLSKNESLLKQLRANYHIHDSAIDDNDDYDDDLELKHILNHSSFSKHRNSGNHIGFRRSSIASIYGSNGSNQTQRNSFNYGQLQYNYSLVNHSFSFSSASSSSTSTDTNKAGFLSSESHEHLSMTSPRSTHDIDMLRGFFSDKEIQDILSVNELEGNAYSNHFSGGVLGPLMCDETHVSNVITEENDDKNNMKLELEEAKEREEMDNDMEEDDDGEVDDEGEDEDDDDDADDADDDDADDDDADDDDDESSNTYETVEEIDVLSAEEEKEEEEENSSDDDDDDIDVDTDTDSEEAINLEQSTIMNSKERPVIYRCKSCYSDICHSSLIISKDFWGNNGEAYFVKDVLNVKEDSNEIMKTMRTGKYGVKSIYCIQCDFVIGWKYITSIERSEKYKINKYVIEKNLLKTYAVQI